MLPCIQWLHKMHWLCEQDKHTHTQTHTHATARTHIRTHLLEKQCRRGERIVALVQLTADDPTNLRYRPHKKIHQSITAFVQICVPEKILSARRRPYKPHVPSACSPRPRASQNLYATAANHTFTTALAKFKTIKEEIY